MRRGRAGREPAPNARERPQRSPVRGRVYQGGSMSVAVCLCSWLGPYLETVPSTHPRSRKTPQPLAAARIPGVRRFQRAGVAVQGRRRAQTDPAVARPTPGGAERESAWPGAGAPLGAPGRARSRPVAPARRPRPRAARGARAPGGRGRGLDRRPCPRDRCRGWQKGSRGGRICPRELRRKSTERGTHPTCAARSLPPLGG